MLALMTQEQGLLTASGDKFKGSHFSLEPEAQRDGRSAAFGFLSSGFIGTVGHGKM
jgi:hypothetical protein